MSRMSFYVLKKPEKAYMMLALKGGGKSCTCVFGGGGEVSHEGQQVCACVLAGAGTYGISGIKSPRCYCPVIGGGSDYWEEEE